jgi:hypothetical protein
MSDSGKFCSFSWTCGKKYCTIPFTNVDDSAIEIPAPSAFAVLFALDGLVAEEALTSVARHTRPTLRSKTAADGVNTDRDRISLNRCPYLSNDL